MRSPRLVSCLVLGGVAAGLAAMLAGPSGAVGDEPAAAPPPVRFSSAQAAHRGRHHRLVTSGGPVHVWIPPGYHPDGAATIVYVHGYYDSVDEAWDDHRLAEQFALSGLNALFLAPEAPQGIAEPVYFPDVMALVAHVEEQLAVWRGTGPLVAVGHSGAYRTLLEWLDEPMLDMVISLDSLYGEEEKFLAWYDASPSHRMITVGDDTVRWTEELLERLPETVVADRFPFAPETWSEQARAARHLYVRSQLGHMALVTDGVAIPLLLRLLPVPRLPQTAWHEPLGQKDPPWAPGGVPEVP